VLVAQLPERGCRALMRTGNYKLAPAKPADDNTSSYIVTDWIKHKQYSGTDVVPTLSMPAVWVVRSSLVGRARRWPCQGAAARRARRSKIQPEHRSIDRFRFHAGAQAALAELGQSRRVEAPRAPSRSRTRRTRRCAPSSIRITNTPSLPCCRAAGGRSFAEMLEVAGRARVGGVDLQHVAVAEVLHQLARLQDRQAGTSCPSRRNDGCSCLARLP
jgi:hypothetical protein